MAFRAKPAGSVFYQCFGAQKIAMFTDITFKRPWNVCTGLPACFASKRFHKKNNWFSSKTVSFSEKCVVPYEVPRSVHFAGQRLSFDYWQHAKKSKPCFIIDSDCIWLYSMRHVWFRWVRVGFPKGRHQNVFCPSYCCQRSTTPCRAGRHRHFIV